MNCLLTRHTIKHTKCWKKLEKMVVDLALRIILLGEGGSGITGRQLLRVTD